MYTSDQFFGFATEYLKLNVSEESIHEVEGLKFADSLLKYNVSGESAAPEKSDRLNALEVYFDSVESDDANVLNEFLRNDDYESIRAWVLTENKRFFSGLIDPSEEGFNLLKKIDELSIRLSGFSIEDREGLFFLALRYKLYKAIDEFKLERSKYN
ncbi:hypothetical protein [Shewanella algae]|uniref:hypothetical protein n=1 Tax=Shewanella algae TaxID=38313 RepID=UPI001FB86DA1|nr:hypothetical protein [Shewanella algae]